jgi:hypothetical protein
MQLSVPEGGQRVLFCGAVVSQEKTKDRRKPTLVRSKSTDEEAPKELSFVGVCLMYCSPWKGTCFSIAYSNGFVRDAVASINEFTSEEFWFA